MDSIILSKALSKKNQANQFSYYLGDNFGSVSFGKPDFDMKMKWAPID